MKRKLKNFMNDLIVLDYNAEKKKVNHLLIIN